MAALHPANNTTMTATKTPSHRLFCIATLIGGLSLITLSGPARAQDSAQTEQAPRWSARQLALAEAFAGALQESLVAGNQGAFLRAWDPAVIARAVCKDVQADEQSLANLRASLERAAGEARASWFADWRQNDVRYKRLVMGDEKLFARFRLIRDGGISFLDIEMESNGGKWRAVGFRNLALGSNLIDTLRQMALPTIEKVDASYATRVFVGAETAEINAESLGQLIEHRRTGNHRGVVAVCRKMPAKVRELAMVTAIYADALATLGETDAFVEVIEQAVARFPAPLFRIALVDTYLAKKQWKKAGRCVDEFMLGVDEDAALLALRAAIEVAGGEIPSAHTTIRRALTLEPKCEYVCAQGIEVLLAAKDWAGVRDCIKELERTGKFDFRGHLEGELWSGFLAASESTPWR